MKRLRLRTFILVSVFIHVIIFSVLAAFFITREEDKKFEITQIPMGLISQNDLSISGKEKKTDPQKANASKIDNLKPKVSSENKKLSELKNEKSINPINKNPELASLKNDFAETIRKNDDKKKHYDNMGAVDSKQFEAHSNANGIKKLSGSLGNKVNNSISSSTSSQDLEIAHPDYKVNPKPKYPMVARRKGYEGSVLLRIWVLESGGVGKIELEKSSGFDVLDNSALDAVKDWVFIPGMRNGVPISSWVTVPIKFQLSSG